MAKPVIQIEGTKELRRKLKKLGDTEIPAAFKDVNKRAADLVADSTAAKVPVRTGRFKQSIRTSGTVKYGIVRMGKASVPYAGWLDFGGAVNYGRNIRPFKKEGRYLFPSVEQQRSKVEDLFFSEMRSVLKKYN